MSLEAVAEQDLSLTCPVTGEVLSVEFELVTPLMAENYLKKNFSKNRDIKQYVVSAYARQIASGLWQPASGECLKFDSDGVLIDGQHRLSAVLKSLTPCWFMVMRGVPHGAMNAIDDGVKRTLADVLTINGAVVKGKMQWHAQVMRTLFIMRDCFENCMFFQTRCKTRVSTSEGIKLFESLPDYAEKMDRFFSLFNTANIQKNSSTPMAMIVYYLFEDLAPEAVFSLMKTLESGIPFDDMREESPAFKVVQIIRRKREMGMATRADRHINYMVWALDLLIKNKKVTQMPNKFAWQFEEDREIINKAKAKLIRE